MNYITISAPPYPFILYAGDALYRAGDMHSHRSSLGVFDMLFVEYGCLYMMEGGTPYEVRQNETLLLHPANTHRSYKRCTEETYFHWIHFHTLAPFETVSSLQRSSLSSQPNAVADYTHCNMEIYNIPVHHKLDDKDSIGIYKILKLLESYTINRYLKGAMSSKEFSLSESRLQQQKLFLDLFSRIVTHTKDSSSNKIAYIIMQFLRSNYPFKISLNDMAEVANCHPTHAIRCFQSEYKTTPGKALTEIRLEEAKKLLLSTSMTCEDIAESVGYSSAAYFSKTFSDSLSLSPMKYRSLYAENV